MDENERITLRLEKENLELIDAFLKENTSHGNRSQLVREAVQAYIQAIRGAGIESRSTFLGTTSTSSTASSRTAIS